MSPENNRQMKTTNDGIEILFCGTGAADWEWERYGERGGEGIRGSCATLIDGHVLIDCGTTGHRSLVRWGIDPRAIREVWFTHSHGDHCDPREISALLDARGTRAAPLRLRGTAPLLERLAAALGGIPETSGRSGGEPGRRRPANGTAATRRGRFEPLPFAPLEPFRAQGRLVTPLPANHLTGIPGETPVHFLVRGAEASMLYALDGAWMTAAARRAIGSEPLDLIVWDATVEMPGDWRIFEHNDLEMVRAMSARLAADGVVRPDTMQVLDHIARTLWRTPIRVPRPFRVASDGMRLVVRRRQGGFDK